MRVLATLVVVALVALGAAAAFIYGGVFNVAATDPHLPAVRWAIERTLASSIRRAAAEIEAPPEAERELSAASVDVYAQNCAICHGAPGQPLPQMARNMRPQPPHFSEQAVDWEPREVFWILQHGIKMTGMPAWGPELGDDELWRLVTVVRALDEMPQDQYDEFLGQGRPASAEAGASGGGQVAAQAEAGGGGDGNPGPAKVEMTEDLRFVPARLTIKAGETVSWTNPSRLPHTVTADPDRAKDESHVVLPDGAEPFHSGFIGPEGQFEKTFTVPGRYKYFCVPHESSGMIGEVIVED